MEKHEDMIEDKTGQRHSIMSLEPSSPSSSGHSIAESEEQYNHDYPETELQPHISHASSVAAIGGIPALGRSQSYRSARSGRSTATSTDPAFEVDFEAGDPDDPQNWSLLRKCLVIAAMSYTTTCVVLFSTSYSAGIPAMVTELGVSQSTALLGLTTYLLGIACGSLVLSSLSEMYGRRPIYIIAVAMFIVLVLPCALVHSIAAILALRFLAAFCAAALISNSPGSINDIVDEEHRILAFSVFSIAPINSPVIGAIAGGFIYEYLGWRWNSWVVMIVTGVGLVFITLIGETYAPVILRRKAAKARKESGDDRYWSRYDEKTSYVELLKINLSRPFVLMCTEPIM
ncbi:hypothetical protein MRB53_039841 [Persea americana]|nr:hypothetical protein MRB53_039841 [Persea americana]